MDGRHKKEKKEGNELILQVEMLELSLLGSRITEHLRV